jgi:hypothetical protein
LKGGAMFCQQTKPRAGVAKNASDGWRLFVTKSPLQHQLVRKAIYGIAYKREQPLCACHYKYAYQTVEYVLLASQFFCWLIAIKPQKEFHHSERKHHKRRSVQQ